MNPLERLYFARNYPFTKAAFNTVKEMNANVSEIDELTTKKAVKLILDAKKKKAFSFSVSEDPELVKQDIAAFPVAKILLSYNQDMLLVKQFASAYTKTIFSSLEKEKDQVLFDIASELGIKYALPEGFFCSVPLHSFLETSYEEAFMKLVNQKLGNGRIFLDRNDFVRMLSEKAATQFLASMPLPLKALPPHLKDVALDLKDYLKSKEEKAFEAMLKTGRAFSGFMPATPEALPPCMKKLYSDLLEGKSIPHSARFALATFLFQANFSKQAILELFKNAPNFNESITSYQLDRIRGKEGKQKYNAPSCKKLKELGLCINECRTSHPMQYYRKKVIELSGAGK